MKKRILLGAYTDSVNAQDINCYYLAKYMDKEAFDVHVLTHGGKIDIPGVKCHVISNNRLIKNIQKLITMIRVKADIYYLPRVEKVDIFFSRLTRRKVTSSVEIQTVYENSRYKNFFNQYIDGYFCISNYLKQLNIEKWKKKVPVLYLGVPPMKRGCPHKRIETVVYVGSVVERKRPQFFLELAKEFSALSFVMIGDGDLLENMKETAKKESINNIVFTGRLNNNEVIKYLRNSDILAMTSSKEGLPKVILEAAACGVVPLYINEFYTVDYIENGINGYGVRDLEQMKDIIHDLLNDQELFCRLSNKALDLYDRFCWENVIREYNDYFMSICDK